jgi:hypothetical protein
MAGGTVFKSLVGHGGVNVLSPCTCRDPHSKFTYEEVRKPLHLILMALPGPWMIPSQGV